MTTYRVEMVKSTDITGEEHRRRLAMAYRIILECARRAQETADGETPADEPSAGEAVARAGPVESIAR